MDLWQNVAGTDLLKACYSKTNNSAFAIQTYIMNTLAQLYMTKDSTAKPGKITFYERSIYSSFNVFTHHHWKNGLFTPTEFAILEQQFCFLKQQAPEPDAIIYLRCQPEIAFDRMNKRKSIESHVVPLTYLRALHLEYENWLQDLQIKIPVYTIDANQSMASVQQHCRDIISSF